MVRVYQSSAQITPVYERLHYELNAEFRRSTKRVTRPKIMYRRDFVISIKLKQTNETVSGGARPRGCGHWFVIRI